MGLEILNITSEELDSIDFERDIYEILALYEDDDNNEPVEVPVEPDGTVTSLPSNPLKRKRQQDWLPLFGPSLPKQQVTRQQQIPIGLANLERGVIEFKYSRLKANGDLKITHDKYYDVVDPAYVIGNYYDDVTDKVYVSYHLANIQKYPDTRINIMSAELVKIFLQHYQATILKDFAERIPVNSEPGIVAIRQLASDYQKEIEISFEHLRYWQNQYTPSTEKFISNLILKIKGAATTRLNKPYQRTILALNIGFMVVTGNTFKFIYKEKHEQLPSSTIKNINRDEESLADDVNYWSSSSCDPKVIVENIPTVPKNAKHTKEPDCIPPYITFPIITKECIECI